VKPSESSSDVKFEIGHVLFIDIVGYSKLLITEQSEQIQTLKEIVRGAEQVRLAEAEGKLLRLPTGDGGALVFRTTPEAPVLCALEISKALKSHPGLRVRMGIHSGPVNAVTDLNEQENIAGAGINIAQRVMDCGDVGHILLSKRVADDIDDYPQWRPLLHDLGPFEVKHGIRIHVVNLYSEDFGNPELPEKFKSVEAGPSRTGTVPAAKKSPVGKSRLVIPALIITALAIGGFVFWQQQKPKPSAAASAILEKSVAVLPFENLSDDKSNAYFAEGIQDEILTKLASVADLKVISRTSTAKYKSKPEDLKTVSQQLGVANVVEGTVQRAADKVRVNVQLIDARADSHLWAKSYDRDVKDVFAVESEVSQEIVDALQAKLSPNEANTLATAPTKDPEAYDLFLKGEYEEREAESSLKPDGFDRAAAWYRQAITRDPNFAIAIGRLAESRSYRHWLVEQLSEAERVEVKQTAERALALAPDSPEAHIAMGTFYYLVERQFDQALAQFQRVLELQPNNTVALSYVGYIHRRQGQWERSLSELEKCERLDPRNVQLPANIGGSYLALRMWKEATRAGSRALALDPHNILAMRDVLYGCLNGTGDVKEATRILATFPSGTNLITNSNFGNYPAIIGAQAYLQVISRDFAAALQTWGTEKSNPTDNRQRLAARAVIHVLAGDAANARDEIERGRDLVEVRLRARPDDKNALTQLGWINVALQHKDEALRLAHQVAESVTPEKDALAGPILLAGLAEIEARTGHTMEAIKTLQRLLSIPAAVSIQLLKIDPVWDPIRNDPGFQQLLSGTELIGPKK
jgi:TolB-like protein/cytochrome c-type biogenesis protein CcmH/NrfG